LDKLVKEIAEYIQNKYKVDEKVAKEIAKYFVEQYYYSVIPDDRTILIEIIEKADTVEYIFHTLVGRKVNDALSRALAYIITKRKKTNVRVIVADNGFILIVPRDRKLSKSEVVSLLYITNLREILEKAIENTELFKRVFRHVAVTGLLLLRRYAGKKKSVNRLQLDAEKLLRFLKKNYPEFPLLKETYRTILEDKLDIENAELFLEKIRKGKIKLVIRESDLPSPFALGMEALGSSDVVLMEDRKELIKLLHKKIMEKIGK